MGDFKEMILKIRLLTAQSFLTVLTIYWVKIYLTRTSPSSHRQTNNLTNLKVHRIDPCISFYDSTHRNAIPLC